jgi:hypothetical protein
MDENNTEKERLNVLNFLNITIFIAQVIISYGFGALGWLGVRTNSEQSDEYQTIITPAGTAFSIWGLIYLSQGIFCVVQLLPSFRSAPLVQQGVKYWFIAANILQSAWTFAFGYDSLYVALVLILLVGVSLIALLISQYYVEPHNKSIKNYWLLQFPFEIHCGWIIAASCLNVNVIIVSEGYDEVVQSTTGIVTLATLLTVAAFVLFSPNKPNYVIPFVFAWASGWIYNELKSPKESISSYFDTSIIEIMRNVSIIMSIIIITMTIGRMVISLMVSFGSRFISKKTGANEVLKKDTNDILDGEVETGLPL